MAVYGIDLGTTYSCIARNDEVGSVIPVELLDAGGRKFIPSVVTYDKTTGQPKVGKTGKACLLTRPECTKAFAKREMHKEFCDAPIVVAGKERKLSPVEASACILRHLVNGANKIEKGAGRKEVHQAVITIPAKFNEQQRARTKLAAELAGIEVLGLLQEPTAAAIAYDIPAGSTVLVFDLGGGTLDVSIVTNDKGDYKVIGTPAGDDQLGGMDWDEALVNLCFQKAGKKVDKSDAKKWNRLMGMAENIKQVLTSNDVIIDDDIEGGNIIEEEEIEIERAEFENVCKKLLDRSIAVVDKAIASAKAQNPKLKIDFFLTVGGSSRMPMIRKMLSKKYGAEYGKGKAEDEWLRINDPDTAIAIGAAKYAQLLKNRSSAALVEGNLKNIEDKATHSYGIKLRKDGQIVIKNVVKSSDPIVFNSTINGISLLKAGREFTIDIYENDIDSGYAPENDSRSINTCSIDMGNEKKKGSPVTLKIDRDKNGLINIGLECDGFKTTIEANPPATLIDNETRKNIEDSIKLME